MAMQKYKNVGKIDRVLPGHTRFHDTRCMPGAVVEIDPEHLKMFAPEDLTELVPYEPEAPAALVAKPAAEPDGEEVDRGELIKLLTQANNVGPQE